MRREKIAFVCFLMTYCIGCTPPVIQEFKVLPEAICAECIDVTLSWNINVGEDGRIGDGDSATITADQPVTPSLVGVTTLAGRQGVNVCDTTSFTLNLTRTDSEDPSNSEAFSAITAVEVQPPFGKFYDIAMDPICDRGVFGGWRSTDMPEIFSALVRVRGVSVNFDRLVLLSHDSITAPIESTISRTDVFDGTSARNGWSASGILLPGEGCPLPVTTGPRPVGSEGRRLLLFTW